MLKGLHPCAVCWARRQKRCQYRGLGMVVPRNVCPRRFHTEIRYVVFSKRSRLLPQRVWDVSRRTRYLCKYQCFRRALLFEAAGTFLGERLLPELCSGGRFKK